MKSFSLSIWCPFGTIPSAAEAAMVSESCRFSLATLEVVCRAGSSSFAVTECEHADVWRWAIINTAGRVVDDGHEPTQTAAKTHAECALNFVAA
ncbi:MAG: hypothetical protein HY302_11230 [Opitutae bacterium]|nr:hypothetical protein [Opitutae bacterium]